MPVIAQVIVVILVASLIGWALWPKSSFVIRIHSGRVDVTRGKVAPGFLSACEEVARIHNLSDATVRGVRRGRSIALRFNATLPAGTRQAFRNVWALHG